MKRMQLAATPFNNYQDQPHLSSGIDTFPGEYDFAEPKLDHQQRLQHTLFVPLHYEKKYAYPLLIWLHSAGDNERQLKRIMPQVSLRNYLAIAPRGTSEDPETDGPTFCWQQTPADVIEAQWRLTQCIETVQGRYNLHQSRIFIGGFGDGGTMALRLALRMPQLCAGAFSINGPLPTNHAPLVNIENARGLPVMLMHGNRSREYPSQHISDDLRLLHAAGLGINIRQYPTADDLTTQMLADVDAWIMQRVTGVPSQSDQAACDLGEWN